MLSHFKLPLFLLLSLAAAWFLGPQLPTSATAFFYAISLTLKEVLLFILPFMIFSFLFHSICQMQSGALRFVLLLIPLVCVSTLVAVMVAYFSGSFVLNHAVNIKPLNHGLVSLTPAWAFSLPSLISNQNALFAGFICGVVSSIWFREKAHPIAHKLVGISILILRRGLVPLMPLFIFGFALKLQHDQILTVIFQNYSLIFAAILIISFSYILLWYAALSGFRAATLLTYLQNMFPAVITAFSTMSSAASMPLTLIASEKNTHQPQVARAVVPATVNIHLTGDCFATPILALAILISFGQPLPSLWDYTIFAGFFVLAKFAVAAVPGGGILVMLPILEQHLHFSPTMLSLITALYILFDPVITTANVLGNGSFAITFARIFEKVKKSSIST